MSKEIWFLIKFGVFPSREVTHHARNTGTSKPRPNDFNQRSKTISQRTVTSKL